MIKTAINSAKKALKGEERLWIVFLGGSVFYAASFLIGLLSFGLASDIDNTLPVVATFISIIMIPCGFFLVFVYPFIFVISLFKAPCKVFRYHRLNYLFPILLSAGFIFIHYHYAIIIFLGTLLFFGTV